MPSRMLTRSFRRDVLLSFVVAMAAAASGAACVTPAHRQQTAANPGGSMATTPAQTADSARAFIAQVNNDLLRLWTRSSTAEWIKNTYITDDTERSSAAANEEVLGYQAAAIKSAAWFRDVPVDPDTARMLHLLRVSAALAAPSDPARRLELTTLAAKLEGLYGKGKWCPQGAQDGGKKECRDLEQLSELMRVSRNHGDLLAAWVGWHSIAREMRPSYARFVELANEGAREVGFDNTGDLWRSAYDMPPADFERETDRLWQQVKPLYDDLHCYVRAQLGKTYGTDKVPPTGPIPAHLLGNMWAQEWANVYPLVEPYKDHGNLDVTAALVKQKYDERRMVKLGEGFFTSLGLDPLPATFWQRSMFVKPRDREVVCHASAWDVTYSDDLRIKMCIKINEEDLVTIHHELGHNYYFHYYNKLPALYQQGANDGFHEAIGDAITLSITPSYLKQVGLLRTVPTDAKGIINVQMKDALEKVAFLPFGRLIDQWRWDVFAGRITPATYNAAWWELRRRYQGVSAPVARTEEDFDPGAKYHIPANVPYMRYFLARILQFQFHRAMCEAAGHKGPLHECSIFGSKEAGARLRDMLALGASRPWFDALQAMTGQREMDAGALLDYFAPLRAWLRTENAGRRCGW